MKTTEASHIPEPTYDCIGECDSSGVQCDFSCGWSGNEDTDCRDTCKNNYNECRENC